MDNIKDKTAIVGIGVTDFSKDSRRTRVQLACESILAAINDAGLKVEDIDGMFKLIDDPTDEHMVMRSLGVHNLTYHGESRPGNSASSGLVMRAAMGVAAGTANYVVIYWTANDSSKHTEIAAHLIVPKLFTSEFDQWSLYRPFGLTSEAAQVAMTIRRYMHDSGATRKQLGSVPVVCREHASKNPAAIHYQEPITIEDYLKSEMIASPLCSLDCYPEVDGAVAMVITTSERAKDLKQKPAYIMASAQSAAAGGWMMTSYDRPDIYELVEVANVGKRLFQMAGVTPNDIDVAQLDDAYAPLVPLQLEALGFCGRGEGAAFCEGGDRIRVGGDIPINTSGGSLGEGYLRSMNHIVEAVRQLRGSSSNQVEDAEMALVTGGAGGPASGIILRR